jgi:hypothetical protein
MVLHRHQGRTGIAVGSVGKHTTLRGQHASGAPALLTRRPLIVSCQHLPPLESGTKIALVRGDKK